MSKVEVRPIPKSKWHGKTGREDFTRPKTIEVLYDDTIGRYATGLSEEEEKKYSELLGGVDLSNIFVPETAHPYWSTKAAQIVLPNHPVFFDTNKPAEFVKIKNMKASKHVANSLTEYENGMWPFATHVIFDEAEQVEIKAALIEIKQQATIKAVEMSQAAKISLIQVIRNKNFKQQSPNFVNVEIADIIEKEPKEFMKFVNMGKDEVTLRATVLELIQKNILTKDGTAIYYMGDQIGYEYEAAVSWFKQPENQKMKIAIFEKLNK